MAGAAGLDTKLGPWPYHAETRDNKSAPSAGCTITQPEVFLSFSTELKYEIVRCGDMNSFQLILPPRYRARFLLLTLICALGWRSLAAESGRQVEVILWFDTEDYLLPADDDAAKRLAEMLSERGIRATFKVVGEKARVLEKRGRADVIAALKKHDIGYHGNFHSVHPTPTEYLVDCGLLDGIAEFARREGGGAADVRRIFGLDSLACYGQPGSSWAAQAIAALPQIGVAPHGVPCYVDEGTHVGLGGKPFWYAGALNVYHMSSNYTRMELHDPAQVEPAKRKFTAIAERLRTGGGLISIFYHPCEWVHREFWDSVNFRRGANPPREDWKPPPQRPPEETEAAFKRFAEYIDHIKSTPGVRFVTASELPSLYPDQAKIEGTSEADLQEIATCLIRTNNPGADFLVLGGKAYSVADQFELLTVAVSQLIKESKIQYPLRLHGALGPDDSPPLAREQFQITWPAFRDATADVLDYLQKNRRIPSRVHIGAEEVTPARFMTEMARVCRYFHEHGTFPLTNRISLNGDVKILPERHIAVDTPELFGSWIIHREGFRAPKVMAVARLQAWTLKPAIRD
jgi:hypothetical protein